jgi:hypothetical protein
MGINVANAPNCCAKRFSTHYKMDKEKQIKELKQLIASATGDNLKWLVKQLDALLNDESDKKQESSKKKKAAKSGEEKKTPREGKEEADKTQASQVPISITEIINSLKSVCFI